MNLGEAFHVVEEGLNGRTTVFENPVSGDKNGLAHLDTVLKSQSPVDVLVIMLGTNDLMNRFNLTAREIAVAMGRLLDLALKSDAGPKGCAPRILLMAPPCLGDFSGILNGDSFAGGRANRESERLKETYAALAEETGSFFLDAGAVVSVSAADAIHLDQEMQAPLAKAVAAKLRDMTG